MSHEGTIERAGGRVTLRFERRLTHPIEAVWDAITQPGQMVKWLAQAELQPETGGAIKLTWLNSDADGNQAVMTGRITSYEPPHLFEFEGDIHGRVRFELAQDGDVTILRFTNELTPPEERFVPMSLAGWHIHLDHLADALVGGAVDWPRWSDDHMPAWELLHEQYVKPAGPG